MVSLAESNADCSIDGLSKLHDQYLANLSNPEKNLVQNETAYDARKHEVRAIDDHHAIESPSREVPATAVHQHDFANLNVFPAKDNASMSAKVNSEAIGSLVANNYPGGDTQPMDTQIYTEYKKSMYQPVTIPHAQGHESRTEDETQLDQAGETQAGSTIVGGGSPKTCQEGDTGFIDLQAWVPQSPASQSDAESGYEELLQDQVEIQGDVARLVPATPAIHREVSGGAELPTSGAQTVTTAKKTPGASQWLGTRSKDNFLSATQMFNQTQAPSSPVPDMLRSDPVTSRPSPNFANTPITSPMLAIASSPIPGVQLTSELFTDEPRETYTSMRESQELRTRIEQAAIKASEGFNGGGFVDFDMEMDATRRQFETRRLKRAISAQTLSECAKIKVSPRFVPRLSSHRKRHTVDLITPLPTRQGRRTLFSVSEAESSDDEPVLNETDELANGQSSPMVAGRENGNVQNDEYDELAQNVIKSQPDDDETDDEETSEKPDDAEQGEEAVERENIVGPDFSEQNHPPRNSQAMLPESDVAEAFHTVSNTQRSENHDSQRPAQHDPSSHCSFVPGSQYAGKTSQEQARAQAVEWKERQSVSIRMDEQVDDSEQIPSSPPLPNDDLLLPAQATSSDQMRTIAQSTPVGNTISTGPKHPVEIPESDYADNAIDEGHNEAGTKPLRTGIPDSANLYSTARSQVSTPNTDQPLAAAQIENSSQATGKLPQPSQIARPSPRKAAGVRYFADITIQPSQASGETQNDIDAIMNDVFTTEDREYQNIISSPSRGPPPRKRQRRTVIDATSSDMPEPPQRVETAHNHESPKPFTVTEETTPAFSRERTDVLRNSPSKANEQLMSPADDMSKEDTAIAVKDQATTNKVDSAVESFSFDDANRQSMSGSLKSEHSKKTYTKRGRKAVSRTEKKASAAPQTTTVTDSSELKEKPSFPEVANPVRLERLGKSHDTETKDDTCARELPILCPHRVLALFRGQYNKHYPATWIGRNSDGKTHRIRFDDTTVLDLEPQHFCRLEFRIGDVVKIDSPEFKSRNWVIKGFGAVAQTPEEQASGVDRYGRVTVKVHAKSSHSTLTEGEHVAENEIVEAPMTLVNVARTSWPQYADRVFIPPTCSSKSSSRAQTPVALNTPEITTPGSRQRRSNLSISKSTLSRSSHKNREVCPSPGKKAFSGMAFALSYGPVEHEKMVVTRLILDNGGTILESGFDELFNVSGVDSSNVESLKLLEQSTATALDIKPEFRHLAFVALIADRHSRRAKYIQALALGLPTLSGRWVIDSLNPDKVPTNDQIPGLMPWSRYLLPAGESTYLGGAIRSRILTAYSAVDSTLVKVIHNRDVLLQQEGVLIVAGKKNKAQWEKRKPYVFLTLALGAGRVRRVSDLEEAKSLLAEETDIWKWLYVDGSISEATEVLFGKSSVKPLKRKRRTVAKSSDTWMADSEATHSVKIVNDEFVIQSLILGALVD